MWLGYLVGVCATISWALSWMESDENTVSGTTTPEGGSDGSTGHTEGEDLR